MAEHRPVTEAEASELAARGDGATARLLTDWRQLRVALQAVGAGWAVERMIDGTWLWSGPEGSIFTLPDTGPVPSLTGDLVAAMREGSQG